MVKWKFASLSILLIGCLLSSDCFGQGCAGNAVRVRATPIRNIGSSILGKISQRVQARATCSGEAATSCSGSSAATTTSMIYVGEVSGNVSNDQAIAQAKSNQQAAAGIMSHVGGSLGSASYEGVGFSTQSPERAVQVACYYWQRPLVASAVSRGQNGWYATNLYK